MPVTIGLCLFLPESWTSEPDRMRIRVPADCQAFRTKESSPSRRLSIAGVRLLCTPRCRLWFERGFGRHWRARPALAAPGIPYKQKVYPADVALIFPVVSRGSRGSGTFQTAGRLRRRRCLRMRPGGPFSWCRVEPRAASWPALLRCGAGCRRAATTYPGHGVSAHAW